MMIDTFGGGLLSGELLYNYLHNLINLFFKILPMKEKGEDTIDLYVKTLKEDLIGCSNVVVSLHDDARFLSLINILQYISDNHDMEVADVKRQVFNAISICNKLCAAYVDKR